MKRQRTRRTAAGRAIMLAAVIGLAAAAAIGGSRPISSLVGSRNATLDGEAPLPHTTLVSGDNLKVADGLAMVALGRGNRMILGRGTEASFSRGADGVTVLMTRGNLSLLHPAAGPVFRVKIGGVTVRPAQGKRVLGEIATADGLLLITAKDGALQVESAGATKAVGKGSTITITTAAARAPGPIPGPAPAPGTPVGQIVVQKVMDVLEVSGGGAGVAIAATALARSGKQVSPYMPAP